MNNKFNKYKEQFLSSLYDIILNPYATDRERKIATLAKQDLESGKYFPAVAKHVAASFEQESLRGNPLTSDTLKFYDGLSSSLDKVTPIGSNRGSIYLNTSYLDNK